MLFKKGQSGNPRGGTKGKGSRTKSAIVAARQFTPELLEQLRKIATGSAKIPFAVRVKAIELHLAYTEGLPPRPAQQLEHSGPSGESLAHVIILPPNGYEINPETRRALYPELIDGDNPDEDPNQKLLEEDFSERKELAAPLLPEKAPEIS